MLNVTDLHFRYSKNGNPVLNGASLELKQGEIGILLGSLLLVLADTLSRSLGSGSALPVGAITSLLGAPFVIAIIFSRKENHKC